MIIHTRKKEHYDYGHAVHVKAASKNIKKSTEERRKFLDKIRAKENAQKEKKLEAKKEHRISELFEISGIYMLYHNGVLVYIGESACILSRICQHRQEGKKEFDVFRIIIQPDEEKRLNIEKLLIRKHSPKYNIVHNSKTSVRTPIIRYREDLSNPKL